ICVLDAQNTTPLIHNGVMYVTASHGRTFAVNARTGSMIWQYNHPLPEDAGKNMCCDIGNRGAALYGDKVFVSTPDAHVVALDMKTGKPVWDVALGDYKNAYSMTGNPNPDWAGVGREGDDPYSNSTLALDPDTGAIKSHFQYTPHDVWDFDGVNEHVLADLGGQKVWLHGDRNGFLYSIDRTN